MCRLKRIMTIYLDNNSTTALDPRLVPVMQPYFCDLFGNSASISHVYGWKSAEVVERARAFIARGLGATDPKEIIFTSGTTESNNLVIKGLFFARKSRKKFHVVTQKTEHACVLESLKFIESLGAEVTCLDVDSSGFVNPENLKSALKKPTALVSIMYANNEIGTIQNIRELARITHENSEALFHTDAAQAVGKIPVDVKQDDVDLLSFSAHKIYGPKGIGAVYVRERLPKINLTPLLHGGGHELGLRSGTLNVPGIAGFAEALKLCEQELSGEMMRLTGLRDDFSREILSKLDYVDINGSVTNRLPGNLNLSFRFVDAGELMLAMPRLAVSSGSACADGSTEPSPVILALGKDKRAAKSSLRFGLGRFTTKDDMKQAAETVIKAVKNLREKSLEYEMYIKRGQN